MKIKTLLFVALLFSVLANAQQNNKSEMILRQIDPSQIIEIKDMDNPPLASKCKANWDLEKRKKCTSEFVQMHVMKKFDPKIAVKSGVNGQLKINIEFLIDTSGKPINISASGGPGIVNRHAEEAISTLPDFIPGTRDGQPVYVSVNLPLMFFN